MELSNQHKVFLEYRVTKISGSSIHNKMVTVTRDLLKGHDDRGIAN